MPLHLCPIMFWIWIWKPSSLPQLIRNEMNLRHRNPSVTGGLVSLMANNCVSCCWRLEQAIKNDGVACDLRRVWAPVQSWSSDMKLSSSTVCSFILLADIYSTNSTSMFDLEYLPVLSTRMALVHETCHTFSETYEIGAQFSMHIYTDKFWYVKNR